MTEVEWLECSDPAPMLEFLRGKVSDRKLRLFAVACCRRIWHLIEDERSRTAADIAERLADGMATEQECNAAEEAADQAVNDAVCSRQTSNNAIPEMFTLAARAARIAIGPDLDIEAARAVVAACSLIALNQISGLEDREAVKVASCLELRELLGNRFRPVTLDPRWLTSTVVDLAGAIYAERAFDRMPILADALMDAGCDSEEIINHCRGAGPHVRGCWVVDLLLGKE